MNDLRVCTKGAGFAVVGALSVAALTLSAFGQGSDTPTNAPAIAAGVVTFGTTAGYNDDTDAVCPYTGSTSPDVFYTYSSAAGSSFSVSLCNSLYDTKVYCIDSATGTLMATSNGSANGVACNDDFCSSPGGGGFRSFIGCVAQSDSGTAIIAVDGYLGASGAYEILVTEQDPQDCLPPGECILECPPGATLEGEGCNFDGADDNFNGGCNSSPPIFSSIACDETVCGTAWINPDSQPLASRDTDWYQLDATAEDIPTSYTWTGIAEFPLLIGRVENDCGALDCASIPGTFAEAVTAEACNETSITTPDLANCLAWFFAAGSNFTDIVDCNQPAGGPPNEIGDLYTVTLTCELGTPPCPWDLDGDQIVGFGDLLTVLSNWGSCPVGATTAPAETSTNVDEVFGTMTAHVVDQSGLSSGYTEGVSDFDAYLAGAPTHDSGPEANVWLMTGSSGNFDMDFGSVVTVDSIAIWNKDDGFGVNGYILFADDDPAFTDPTQVAAGALTMQASQPATPHDRIDFDTVSARYFRIQILGNHGAGFTGLSELVFRRGCVGDLDGDGDVGFSDLLKILSLWGPCPE